MKLELDGECMSVIQCMDTQSENAADIEKQKKKNYYQEKTKFKIQEFMPPKVSFNVGQGCHYVEYQPDGASVPRSQQSYELANFLRQFQFCTDLRSN